MSDIDSTLEVWKPVPDFPDYAVSNRGRIKRIIVGRRGGVPGILRPHLNNKGYAAISLMRDGKPYRRLVSRVVCHAFHGPPPTPKHDAAHNDGVPIHNLAENLRWATRSENMADCVRHGTQAVGIRHGRTTKPERTPRGTRHGHAKLREDQVIAIRDTPQSPGIGRRLAHLYGISTGTVSLIRSRKIWTHL